MALDRAALAWFTESLGAPESERAAALGVLAAAQPDLFARVMVLERARLQLAQPRHAEFLQPVARAAVEAGQRVGAWRLVEPIGAGGMGEVWRAERADGQFRKTVALKLLHAGAALERFARAERELLGQLQNPHIVSLVDSGVHVDGRAYVVMEWIDGHPIDRFANEMALDVAARVRLFLQVLDAIDAAHRALVIHRDIKPANVLVDRAGSVKLLDFGIAKSLDPAATAATATRAMTPDYASPEQLEGLPLTTATDVYSAALLLHELLTGHRPFAAAATLSERLSQMQRTVPALGGTEVATEVLGAAPRRAWQRRLGGDLSLVLAKALRFAPGDRYASAREFAADLGRWLEQRPVQARRGSRGYALSKFVERHRGSVALAAAAGFSLLLGLGLFWHQALETARAAERTRIALEFWVDMIRSSDPYSGERPASLVEVIDRAAAALEERIGDDPELEGTLRAAIGSAYSGQYRLDAAQAQLERALQLLPADSGDRAKALEVLAGLEFGAGDLATSERRMREAIAIHDALPRNRHHAVLTRLSWVSMLEQMGRTGEALALSQESERRMQALMADEVDAGDREQRLRQVTLGDIATRIGDSLETLDRLDEAAAAYAQALAHYARNLPEGAPQWSTVYNNFAFTLRRQGKAADAAEYYAKALALRRSALGVNHPRVAAPQNNLAHLYAELGRHEEACDLMQRSLDAMQFALRDEQLHANDPLIARTHVIAGEVLALLGDREHLAPIAVRALALARGMAIPDAALVTRAERLLRPDERPMHHACDLRTVPAGD